MIIFGMRVALAFGMTNDFCEKIKKLFLWKKDNNFYLLQLDSWFSKCRLCLKISSKAYHLINDIIHHDLIPTEEQKQSLRFIMEKILPTEKEKGNNISFLEESSKSGQLFEFLCLQKGHPYFVGFEIIQGCNLTCTFCYVDELQKGVMSLERAKIALKKLRDDGCMIVNITGGEPTLHSRFAEIVDYAIELGFAVSVRTNLYKLPRNVERWKNSGRVTFVVSFHDSREENFDKFVGKNGAFESILKNVAQLRSLNIQNLIQTVIQKGNEDVTNQLIDLYEKHNIHYILSDILFHHVGKDEINFDNYHYEAAPKKVADLKTGKKLKRKRTACTATKSKLKITWEGDILPCEMIQHFTMGNIFKEDLFSQSVQDKAQSWRDEYQGKDPEKCNTCALSSDCPHCPAFFHNKSYQDHHCDRTHDIEGNVKMNKLNEKEVAFAV